MTREQTEELFADFIKCRKARALAGAKAANGAGFYLSLLNSSAMRQGLFDSLGSRGISVFEESRIFSLGNVLPAFRFT
jgi:hypothetical protein